MRFRDAGRVRSEASGKSSGLACSVFEILTELSVAIGCNKGLNTKKADSTNRLFDDQTFVPYFEEKRSK